MTAGPAIVSLGPRSAALALRLRGLLPGSEVHAPACADCAADVRFAKARTHLAGLFAAGRPIVGLCASGILIRAVAPVLGDKTAEPAGRGRGRGRLGRGAAAGRPSRRQCAGPHDRGRAAGNARQSPPPATTASASPSTRRRRAGPWPIPATPRTSWPACSKAARSASPWSPAIPPGCARPACPSTDDAPLELLVTHRAVAGTPDRLVYHPPVLALGVGAEAGAPAGQLADLVEATLAEHGLAPAAIACVVSLDLKAAEPAVHALAARLGVPARFFAADRLLAETPRLATRSEIVFRETGCWGVAEGAALAAAGTGRQPPGAQAQGRARHLRRRPGAARPGSRRRSAAPRGGSPSSASGPATRAGARARRRQLVAGAEELVGYGLYLDLIGPAAAGKPRHEFPLGAEVERCRFALARAAEGRGGGPGLLGRSRHLRPGDAGVRAAGERGRPRLGARRDHRQPGRLGPAGGGRARRRPARPRFLRDLALRSADARST